MLNFLDICSLGQTSAYSGCFSADGSAPSKLTNHCFQKLMQRIENISTCVFKNLTFSSSFFYLIIASYFLLRTSIFLEYNLRCALVKFFSYLFGLTNQMAYFPLCFSTTWQSHSLTFYGWEGATNFGSNFTSCRRYRIRNVNLRSNFIKAWMPDFYLEAYRRASKFRNILFRC